jgi:hypothetical protein
MPRSVSDLMYANLLEVFNERDDAKRQAAEERTYASNVRWTDAEGVSTGLVALETKCVGLQQGLGDLQFEADGPVHELPGFGYLAWRLVDAEGGLQMSGFDAAQISGDLITDLWTVLIPPQG